MKRRTFLIGSAAAVGGLALGYRLWTDAFEAQAAALVTRDGESLLGGWIKIAPTTRSRSTFPMSTWARACTPRSP